ncbi:MAG: HEAT repeat domain-containing protein, partial [Deltaproteobacteria bacterium]|nr:HEAT repeat domain-containing protein [Deltaproteobacteria bacterium]
DLDMLVRFVERFGLSAGAKEKGILAEALGAYLVKDDPYEQREALRAMALIGDHSMKDLLVSYAKNAQYDEETRDILKGALVRCMSAHDIIEAAKIPGENLLVFVDALFDMADPESIPELKIIFDSTDDWRVKRSVINALVAIGSDKGMDTFKQALSDDVGNVRRSAAVAIKGFRDSTVIEMLLDAIKKEPYEDVREAMADALVSYSGEDADEVFRRFLESEESFLRSVGIKGFSRMAPSDLALRLAWLLMKDDAPTVRCDALNGFRYADSHAMFKAAVSAMNDQAKEVRGLALDMLFEMADGVPYIIEALSDEDIWVRFKAAGMLSERPAEEAEERLLHALEKDEIPVKVHAAKALGAIRSKKSVPLLRGFMEHDDETLKEASREALSMCLA